MKKVSGENLTAGMLSQNFKETVKEFIANDKAFSFMSSVKGTPAYWKRFLQEILAIVKQIGPPAFFLTLSYADLRWNELVSIIYKLKGQNISENEINSITYQDICKLSLGGRVFIKNVVECGGPGKLRSYFERKVYVVKKTIEGGVVYTVQEENNPNGRERTVHRNLVIMSTSLT